jgi:hypothetical protein
MGEIALGASYQNIALVTGRRYSNSQSSDEKSKHGRNNVDSGVATEKKAQCLKN